MQEILTNNKFFFKEIILLDLIVFLFVFISHLIVIRLFFNELNRDVTSENPVIASKIYFSPIIKKQSEKKILIEKKPKTRKLTKKKPKIKKVIREEPKIKKIVDEPVIPEEQIVDKKEKIVEEIVEKEDILENSKNNSTFIENLEDKNDISNLVEIAQVNYFDKKKCSPRYPRISIKRGEKGKVLVSVIINKEGFVDLVELVESSGFKRLDDAAIKAAKNCRFIAARRGGVAVRSKAKVPYNFVY